MSSEKVIVEANKALDSLVEYYYSSIDSLTNKAGNFLSFSSILGSLLGGYLGVLFLLIQERVIVISLVFNIVLYAAIGSLIAALLCLLFSAIIGVQCLNPKIISAPISVNIDELLTADKIKTIDEWHKDRQDKLVEAISENEKVTNNLRKKVRNMGLLIAFSSVFFAIFIILTLAFSLGNPITAQPTLTNSTITK